MKEKLRLLLKTILILAGVFLTLYPWISNYLYERDAGSQVSAYQASAEEMTEEGSSELWKKAEQYNEKLSSSQVVLTDPFRMQVSGDNKKYQSMLKIDKTGIMASIEIPCIGVSLPVYHGTSSEVLEKGVGHLEGSSLPVGGTDTHAVLTGHTGLNSAKLFTDLVEIKEGDLFYIRILGQVLAYRTDQIKVVRPEETSDLHIVHGQDYVTLVTCTPYGVNSHRILVRGKRTEYQEKEYTAALGGKRTDSQWMKAYRRALLLGLAAVGSLGAVIAILRRRKERKGRKEC